MDCRFDYLSKQNICNHLGLPKLNFIYLVNWRHQWRVKVEEKYWRRITSLVDILEKYLQGEDKNCRIMTNFCNCFFILMFRERKASHILCVFFFLPVNYGRFHYVQFDFNCRSCSSGVQVTVIIVNNDSVLHWSAESRESRRLYKDNIKHPWCGDSIFSYWF